MSPIIAQKKPTANDQNIIPVYGSRFYINTFLFSMYGIKFL